MSPADLETLGFFPPGLAARARVAGNLSLAGATLFLTDRSARGEARALAGRTAIVPLAGGADMSDSFIRRMVFAYVP